MADLSNTVRQLADKLTPTRKRAGAIFLRSADNITFPSQNTTAQDWINQPLLNPYSNLGVSAIRSGMIKECWDMYLKDDRIRAEIAGFARDVTRRGIDRKPFNLKVNAGSDRETKRLEEELEVFLQSLKIYKRLTDFVIGFLNEGTRFYRKTIDLGPLRSGEASRVVKFDLIPGPRLGFVMEGPIEHKDPLLNGGYIQYQLGTATAVNFFFGFEVTRFDWDYDEDFGYGLPLMSSGRINYKRIDINERDLSTARNKRAYTQLAILLEGGAEEFDKMVRRIEDARRKKGADTGVTSDLYFGGTKDVKPIDHASSALTRIDDIKHAEDKMRSSLLRPRGLSGSGGANINRAVLDLQTYNWLNGAVVDGEETLADGLQDLIGTQLLLMRQSPQEMPVSISWPPKHMPDSTLIEQYRKANAAGKVSDHTYLTMMQTNFEREQELIEQEATAKALMQERLRKIMKTDTNDELNNNVEPEDDEEFAESLQEIAQGNRNGATQYAVN